MAEKQRREIRSVGFLGISDYGLGQLRVLCSRYRVAFATGKRHTAAHASEVEVALEQFCAAEGIEFLGNADVNSEELIARAKETDLVIIGGHDAILKRPILEAPRHGVLNTHLGVLPANRGCCPTMWAQIHGLPQGYTTYRVETAIDFGVILDQYVAEDSLGALRDNNRHVYDVLAEQAVARFPAALDRFESGEVLTPCMGVQAYHRKGMPNDSWLSFQWSNEFLHRCSLALDFLPYLPGKAQISSEAAEGGGKEVFFVVEATKRDPDLTAEVGEVLESSGDLFQVRSREGVVFCRRRKGPPLQAGLRLSCGLPDSLAGTALAHPIERDFDGVLLPLDRYVVSKGPASTRTSQ